MQNFYSTDSALDIAKDWLLHLHSPSEEAQTTLDERKIEINQTETFVCTCLGSGFSVSEQVFDLLMNSSQTYGTWQECLSLLQHPKRAWQLRQKTIHEDLLRNTKLGGTHSATREPFYLTFSSRNQHYWAPNYQMQNPHKTELNVLNWLLATIFIYR